MDRCNQRQSQPFPEKKSGIADQPVMRVNQIKSYVPAKPGCNVIHNRQVELKHPILKISQVLIRIHTVHIYAVLHFQNRPSGRTIGDYMDFGLHACQMPGQFIDMRGHPSNHHRRILPGQD
ncbi:hypothetical protein D3C81_1921390 [compost metagenome]